MIKDWLKRALGGALAALVALPPQASVWAAEAAAASSSSVVSVQGIDVGADSVRVKLTGSAAYKSFTTASPARLVLEFQGVKAPKKSVPGSGPLLKDVRSGQFTSEPLVARVVLDLGDGAVTDIKTDGNDVVVALKGAAEDAAHDAPAAASSDAGAAEPAPKAQRPKVSLPKAADLSKVGETGGMTTQPSPDLAEMAKDKGVVPADASLGGTPPPAATTSLEAVGRPRAPRGDIMSRLPRDLVTLDFDNTDIRDVLKLLSAKAKINVIYGPDVSGTLTLHLTDVPFADAFRTIITMMGLATTQVGDNILRVLPPASLKTAQTQAAPVTKVIPLNYAKASELVTSLNQIRTAEGITGMAVADNKTNSLIITESADSMLDTERLVSQLDVRPKQVLIEVKLVEVGLTNSLNFGIQWDYTSVETGSLFGKQGTTYNGTTVGPAGGATGLLQPLNAVPGTTNGGNTIPPVTSAGAGVGASGRGTGVNLPATQVFGALTLGRITNNYFVNATLTAAAADGKVKVLSDPKVATLNNQPANINVTTQIPYVTSNVASTGVQTQSVSYVTTGIQLAVTPTINADGRITLNLNPNVSQPSASVAASITGAPAVDSRNAQTTVLVRDGETIVIGGLINDSMSNQIAKIPLLGDIPILGWLFKKKSVTRTRAELLIFVTTKIMPE